MMVIKDRNM